MKIPTPLGGAALALLVVPALTGQQLCGEAVDAKLLTRAERSGWQATSSSAEVQAFMQGLQRAYPKAFVLSSIGRTLQGRPIQVAVVKRDGSAAQPRLRVVIQANIHGGEIEGKEVVQILLREIALGGHQDILQACDIWFVPIFNVDGNDEVHAQNRASQNGPGVVGKRSNAQGLDLNRDFVKVESPEVRAMIGLFNRVDPHFYMDLHTTNGTTHGYHLTYAPALTTNQDPDLDQLMHQRFLPAVRATMQAKHGLRIFDYGNAPRRGRPSNWTTFGHTPRYASNYSGLRNRLSLLTEAYSYLPFRQRALATRAFVLESLRELTRRSDEVHALCQQADQRLLRGKVRFGYASRLRQPVRGKILMGSVKQKDRRRVAETEFHPVEMGIQVRFAADKSLAYPAAWAVVGAVDAVRKALITHGLEVERVTVAARVVAEEFVVGSMSRARYVYEGHRLVSLVGELKSGEHRLPVGTLLVRSRQRRARIAAQLLEGHSEDSLASWNYFDAQLGGDARSYPVFRIADPAVVAALQTTAIDPGGEDLQVSAVYRPLGEQAPANSIRAEVRCLTVGQRRARGGFEQGSTDWRGRSLEYQLGKQRFTEQAAFTRRAAELLHAGEHCCVLAPGNAITSQELLEIARLLHTAGATEVYLDRRPE